MTEDESRRLIVRLLTRCKYEPSVVSLLRFIPSELPEDYHEYRGLSDMYRYNEEYKKASLAYGTYLRMKLFSSGH